MEILSDATFKGNVSIDGQLYANCVSTSADVSISGQLSANGGISTRGAFSVTKDQSGRPNPLIEINKSYCGNNYSLYVDGSEWIEGSTRISGDLIAYSAFITEFYPIHISLDDGKIDHWSDLNNILCFAPSSLSCTVSSLCTTVSSHTTKINSACSTISSLCTKVNSLCTTVSSNTTKINSLCTKVDGIQSYTKYALGNPSLPVGCTKFYFVDNTIYNSTNDYSGCKADLYRIVKITDSNGNEPPPSSVHVFKGGWSGMNEEVQMDVKQYNGLDGSHTRWFEGTLASNTTGYDASEFIITFDEFKAMCGGTPLPQ